MEKQKVNIVEGHGGVKYAERNGVVCPLDLVFPEEKEFRQQAQPISSMTKKCHPPEN